MGANNPMTVIKVIDPILTEVAHGYTNNAFTGNEIFPEVTVSVETGQVPKFNKDSFVSHETERALNADSNRIQSGIVTTVPFALREHDLEEGIDLRKLQEPGTIPLKLESFTTQRVQDLILLAKEIKQAAAANNSANYDSGNVDTRTTDTYLSIDTIDPLEELEKLNTRVRNNIAKKPNLISIPEDVWRVLRNNPILKSYFKTISESNVVVTPDQLAKLLDVQKIIVPSGYYKDPATGKFMSIWGNNIGSYYIAPPSPVGRNEYEPSFGYTLKKSGYPFVDTRMAPNNKVKLIRCTDLYEVVIVGNTSGALMKNPILPSLLA